MCTPVACVHANARDVMSQFVRALPEKRKNGTIDDTTLSHEFRTPHAKLRPSNVHSVAVRFWPLRMEMSKHMTMVLWPRWRWIEGGWRRRRRRRRRQCQCVSWQNGNITRCTRLHHTCQGRSDVWYCYFWCTCGRLLSTPLSHEWARHQFSRRPTNLQCQIEICIHREGDARE